MSRSSPNLSESQVITTALTSGTCGRDLGRLSRSPRRTSDLRRAADLRSPSQALHRRMSHADGAPPKPVVRQSLARLVSQRMTTSRAADRRCIESGDLLSKAIGTKIV